MSREADVGNAPFAGRSTRWWLLGGGLSLVAAFALLLWRSENLDRTTVDSNAWSRSALGHRAFVALLEARGVPVVLSRFQRQQQGSRALIVCAEPLVGEADRIDDFGDDATLLLVLPKRTGERDSRRQTWIESSDLRKQSDVEEVLDHVWSGGKVVRLEAAPAWQAHERGLELPLPTLREAQLVRPGRGLRPLVDCSDGVLLGKVEGGPGDTYVLADPDILSNHGLDDGDNADFAAGLVEQLARGRVVVVDETVHGFELQPNVWTQLGSFPLVLLPVHLALLLALVLWTAAGRFLPLVPPPPAIAPGKAFLVEQMAELMQVGDGSLRVVERFCRERLRAAGCRVAARPLDQAAAVASLRARAAALGRDGLELALTELDAAAKARGNMDPRELVQLARRVHRECEEIVHGRK